MSGKRGTKRRITPIYVGPIKRTKTMAGPVTTGRITRRYLGGTKTTKKVLRYYENFTLNPASGGTPALRQYRMNGLFDPTVIVGGHQPRGFDQYMAMYDHYTVVKCTARVYFDNNAEQSGMLGVLTVRDTDTVFTDQRDVMEYGMKSVARLMAANSGSGGSMLATATISCDIAKFLGVKDILDERALAGTIGSDPAEQVTLNVTAFPINTGDAAPINCAIELEYEVIFHEPKNPTLS